MNSDFQTCDMENATLTRMPLPSSQADAGTPAAIEPLDAGGAAPDETEDLDQNKEEERQSSHEDQLDDDEAGNNPSFPLQPFDWPGLEDKFAAKMEESYREEQTILGEYYKLTEYYNIWAQSGEHQEQERASKRLRTRIAYVQNSENELEEKRNHHEKVVRAFQSALQLLGGT